MNHIIEHCGNFSPEILEGLIGYGREVERGRGKIALSNNLPSGDGYATKEADILLGGFVQRYAAKQAARENQRLSALNVQQMERLAFKIARSHLEKYGTIGNEHYGRWMIRAKGFAKSHQIEMPRKEKNETDHQYFRGVRKWVKTHDEKWPELRPAAGAHLVFSPDTKIWEPLRAMGLDERLFLKTVITQTMKEFSDWRRKQLGCNHSLGWVVGTHVEANGADRHPHIHLVVLKRDEVGKEVDWSVSSLKGRVEKTDPDPMKELKRVFGKNVEKHLERMLGKENDLSRVPTRLPVISQKKKDLVHRFLPNLYRVRFLGRSLRAVFYVMQSHQRFTPDMITQNRNHIGAILRFVALARRNTEIKHSREVSLPEITISDIQQKIRQLFHRQKEKSLDMELEP